MPNPGDDQYGYYAKAVAALNSDDFMTASTLCESAGNNFERSGSFHEASVAYDLLGLVHYQAGALEDAESAYLKSLALIDRTDGTSDLEYAKTCNSLAAVVNAMRDHARAMDWLSKSLHIKEELQDKPGLISTYHQMGIIEQSRSDLEEARRWYKKALALEKSEGDIAGLVGTVRCLASTMGDESDPEAVDDIYRIATDAIEKTGDAMLAKTAADRARKDYDFRAATEFYRKAYEMAATGKSSNKANRQAEIIKRLKGFW